ncbi:MAG TPA: hypothetical protein VJN18_14960 [Polyangiaceae bacterium]|nr:hypothetical protein [Polyangiaceae bacterium]
MSATGPFDVHINRLMLGAGDVWLTTMGSGLHVTFNAPTWRLEGLPCVGEQPLPAPVQLAGRWEASSVCEMDSLTVVASRVNAVMIEVEGNRVVIDEAGEGYRTCSIDRFSEVEHPGRVPTKALRCAIGGSSQRGPALTLRCGNRAEQVLALGDELSTDSWDGSQFIRLRRVVEGRKRLAQGAPCGSSDTECAKGLVCEVGQPLGLP